MSRRRIALTLILPCLLSSAAVAKDVVQLLPNDTLGYVIINRLAETDSKVQALGQRMQLPIPSFLSFAKEKGQIAQGVDQSGSMAAAFVPTAQGPSAVLYIPIGDYGAFLGQFETKDAGDNISATNIMGQSVIVVQKDNYAVVAWPGNEATLKKITAGESAVTGNAVVQKAKVVADHDVVAFVSTGGIRMLTALGQQGLQEAKKAVLEQFDEDNPALAGIDLYVHLLNAIGSEISRGALGLKIDENNSIRIDEWVWFQPTGKVAPILHDLKPPEGDLLSSLPKIPFVIAFGGAIPNSAFEPMMELSGNLMKSMPQLYGLSPDQVDKMIEMSVEYFPDMRGMSFLLGVGQDDAPLYNEMVGAMYVADAKSYVAKYRKYWEELDTVIGDAEKSFLKDAELEDISVGGQPVLKIKMPIPGLQDLELPNQGELDQIMEKMYGPDGLTVFLAAADDHTVLMGYTDVGVLEKALEATDDKSKQISQDPNVVRVTEQLPTDALAVGYWSPSGTMAFAKRMMQLMPGAEKGVQLPDFPETTAVGWAMTATSTAVRFNTVVPAETLEAVGSFAKGVGKLNAAPRPRNPKDQ